MVFQAAQQDGQETEGRKDEDADPLPFPSSAQSVGAEYIDIREADGRGQPSGIFPPENTPQGKGDVRSSVAAETGQKTGCLGIN